MIARLLTSTAAALLFLTAPAGAAVQLDFSSAFNADVIVNTDGGQTDGLDQSQTDADGSGTAFLTQAVANQYPCPTPAGLPDAGAFPANGDHPAVQLAYRDSDSGDNVRKSTGADSYEIPVAQGTYNSVHVFATGGGGSPVMNVALNYTTGMPTTASFTVADWFFEPEPGIYALVDGMDRTGAMPMSCEDSNTVAVFGHEVTADATRNLVSITISRPMTGGGNGILVVLGATAEENAVAVTRAGMGSGTVTSDPAGIACGSDCVGNYAPGQQVVLTATPDAGSTFSGWSGACSGTGTCMLTTGGEQAVTATFTVSPPPPPPGDGGGTGTGGTGSGGGGSDGTGSTSTGTGTGAGTDTGTNTGTTSPPDTSAPVARLAVAGQRLSAVVRRGLSVAVTCSEACAGGIDLLLDVRSARRLGLASATRPVRIGRASVRLTAAGRRTVTAKLTRKARSRLRRARTLTVGVRLTVRDAAGNATSRTAKVRLRG